MDDKSDMDGKEEKDVPAPSRAVPGDDAGTAAAESGQDICEGSGLQPEVAVSRGGGAEVGKPEGGGLKRYFTGNKLLAGAVIGALTVMIVAGIFIVGYYVGKPGESQKWRDFSQPSQTVIPGPRQRNGMRSAPSPERGGAMGDLPGVMGEYREEIEDGIAAVLGISADELQEQLEDGKTIAETAEEEGIPEEDLVDAAAAKIGEIADRLAAEKDISDERAEEIKSNAESIASRLIKRGWRRAPMPFE